LNGEQAKTKIVGIGEVLFDCFQDHATMGGAPLNAALVAHALGAPWGLAGQMVSRVGPDDLGQQIVATLRRRELDTSSIQHDPTHPTGTVQIELIDGEPNYEFVPNVAWDHLQWSPAVEQLATQTAGVTFGTLGQRAAISRTTIQRFLAACPAAIKFFDVNLRGDFYSADVLRASCQLADAVKLNEEELHVVTNLLGLSDEQLPDEKLPEADMAIRLMDHFQLRAVVLTHGSQGTELITARGRFTGPVPKFAPEADSDPVGAGDACGATCLLGLIQDWPEEQIVTRANRVGAFVASRRGATPQLDAAALLSTE